MLNTSEVSGALFPASKTNLNGGCCFLDSKLVLEAEVFVLTFLNLRISIKKGIPSVKINLEPLLNPNQVVSIFPDAQHIRA